MQKLLKKLINDPVRWSKGETGVHTITGNHGTGLYSQYEG